MSTNNDQSAEAKRARIRQAQAALRATGKSPRQLGIENELRVIDWIYRWGWSGAGPINLLLNRTSGGYAQRLVKKKSPLCYPHSQRHTPRVLHPD